jgi:hypothetical protein
MFSSIMIINRRLKPSRWIEKEYSNFSFLNINKTCLW